MKKKLICLILAVCLSALLCVPAMAQDDGYVITDYQVDAVLHENNTITQTETISVDFLEERHGIFRAIPEYVTVQQETGGALQDLSYRVKIEDVSVASDANMPYDTYSEDDVFWIKMGDPDATVSGPVTYEITFTYDVGDDRVPEYDMLFYSFNGPDWDTTVENLSFDLQFETPLSQEALDGLSLYSGDYGSTGNDAGIEYEATADGISGYSTRALAAGESVTVYTRMENGYFVGARKAPVAPFYVALVLLAAALVFAVLHILRVRRRNVVETVEFYPPEGMTSAEVGYIIDGEADDKDMVSLIIWMADKGYLSIQQKEKCYAVHKENRLPKDAPEYLKTFYNALFAKGDTRSMIGMGETFAQKFLDAKAQLGTHFTGERALTTGASHSMTVLMPLLCCFLWILVGWFAGSFISSFLWLVAGIAVLPLFAMALLGLKVADRWRFSKGGKRFGYIVLYVLLGLIALGLLAAVHGSLLGAHVVPLILMDAGWLGTLLVCLGSFLFTEDSAYRIEMAGKLLGLRSFIEKAEVPKLKMLVEQDPTYFYSVMPFAYVLGLSDKWVKQFETLAIQPPQWYSGNSAFDYLYLSNSMSRSISRSVEQLHTETSKSGGGGGTSFGGGGGFSGGGFGGGGGGSW